MSFPEGFPPQGLNLSPSQATAAPRHHNDAGELPPLEQLGAPEPELEEPPGRDTEADLNDLFLGETDRLRDPNPTRRGPSRLAVATLTAVVATTAFVGYWTNRDVIHQEYGCPDIMQTLGFCVQQSSWWPF